MILYAFHQLLQASYLVGNLLPPSIWLFAKPSFLLIVDPSLIYCDVKSCLILFNGIFFRRMSVDPKANTAHGKF